MTGKPFDERRRGPARKRCQGRIQPKSIRKAVYRGSTDASFTTLKPQPAAWDYILACSVR